ncbi:MAG TPA: carboxypeptidase-like regulatory domain-containing protein [Terriglobales bacterium]
MRLPTTIFALACWALIALACGTLGHAQKTTWTEDGPRAEGSSGSPTSHAGSISGTVLAPTGSVAVGAKVRLIHEGQASDSEKESGNNGEFVFSNVIPGPFHLTVTASGFTSQEFSATLTPGETFLVPNIVLAVAPAVTEVRVEGTPLSPVEVADIQIKEQEEQRVFGVFPNFYVTYDKNAVALDSRQKFRLAWKTMIDPFTFVGTAAIAGLEQATDAYSGYGQGAAGYFKRFGAGYADTLTGTYIGGAILPALFKQDPRYFYKGKGSAGSRLLYALGSTVICKGDNMRWQANYSNVLGAFASAGISYAYYPASDRNGAGLVVENSMIRLGEISFEGVLQEFVIRRLTPAVRKRSSDQR